MESKINKTRSTSNYIGKVRFHYIKTSESFHIKNPAKYDQEEFDEHMCCCCIELLTGIKFLCYFSIFRVILLITFVVLAFMFHIAGFFLQMIFEGWDLWQFKIMSSMCILVELISAFLYTKWIHNKNVYYINPFVAEML